MKRSLKVLAFVMAVFMFIGAVPAYAVDDLSEDIEVEKKQVILDLNSVSIEEEIVEKRGENVKHFKLNNDTCIVVQYAQPIHYLDANGNWVEYADDYSIFNGNSNIESYLYYFGIANTRIYENNDSIIASIGNATNQSAITISLPFANSAANGSRSNIDEEIDISNNEETDDIGREIETTDAALSSEESESEDDSLSREDNEELSDDAAENDPNGEETTEFVDENDEVQEDQEEVTEESIPEDTDFEDPASETTEIDELESESTESADLEPEVTENEPFEEITDEEKTTNDENVYDKNIEIIESAVKKATRSYTDVVNGLTAEIISFSNGFTYKLSADNGSFPEYVVSVNDGRLIAVDDGGIEFFDGNGKAVYKIIAPYAYDSDGKVYDELDFELFSIGNDKYELTINSTDNLLNSAAMLTYVFSVITVDDCDESLIELSSEDNINTDYSKGLLCVGSDGLGQIERSILTYSSLPELDKYDIMLSTLFNMYLSSGANNSSLEDLSFNNVSEAWNENTTWYSRPNVTGKRLFTAEKEISGAFCYDRAELVSVDVTKTVRDWYDEKENYGVYISNNDETKASKTLIYTSFSEVNYHPYTIINYLSGSMLGSGEESDSGINKGIGNGQSGEGENPRSMEPMPGGGGGSNNTFEEITGVAKEYYNGTSWQTISGMAEASDRVEGVKLQTSNQPYYLVYRSRSNERGWEDYVSSNNSGAYDFAGYFGCAMTNLEIQVFEGNDRIYDNYVIMFRAKVAGQWLDWVSNGSAEIMSTIKSEYQLDGGLDTVSVEAGWASLGSIQALQIRMFKRKSYTPPTITETESGAFAVATGIGKSYRPLSTYTWTSFSSDITSNCTNGIDGVKLQTSGKPYHFYYRVRDSYHGWLDYVDSRTTSGDDSFAGWGSYPIYNLEINVRDSSNNNLSDTYVVMYRAKVAGQWLDWVSNGTSQVMQEIKTQFSLSGNLDANATDAGYFSLGPITQLEIRVYERDTSGNPIGTSKIIDAPYINQGTVGMPTGCEPVSAVMAMQYFGIYIDPKNFVKLFLDKEPYIPGYSQNPNPAIVFVGDPCSTCPGGWGCYKDVIEEAILDCLSDSKTLYSNSANSIFDVEICDNQSVSSLCSEYIDNNVPVIIWATVGMTNQCTYSYWISKDKNENNVSISYNNMQHCLLLVGYDDCYYYFNDPLVFGSNGNKYVRYLKSSVETAFNTMGKQAVAITNQNTTGVGTASNPGYSECQGYSDYSTETVVIPIEPTSGDYPQANYTEDPIDLSTGSHVISHNLMTINGAQSISFNINYSSNLYIDGPLGYGWSHEFDKHIVETGNTINLFSGPAYYSVYTCSSGNVYTSNTPTHQYNTLIKGTTTYELKNRDGSKEIYDSNGKLTSIVSKGGLTVSITYPTNTQIRVTENVSGRYFTIETNTDGKIISITDNDNRVAALSYTDDYLTGITDVNGKTISYLYNDNGQIYRGMDGKGTIFFTDYYDSYGRISSQKDAIADHEMSEISYEDIYSGNTFLYRLVTATDRNQKTSTYKYNQNKQLTEYTDANGVTTTYEYNSNGDLTKETNGLGYYVRRVFDASGNVIETYDALNNMTEYTYDNNHNLIQIEYPNGSTITKTYNSDNLVTSVTDLRGVTTYYEYNTSKLLSRVTCVNRVTEYDYSLGQVTTITDPLGRETTNVYNSRGFLTSTTDAKNNTTQYTYDNSGNVTSITDATNHTATNVYDCNGCITSSTDFAGNTTTYTYDGNLNMTSMTLPINATIYYEYDGEDRLTSTLYPDGKSSLNTYDNGGRIISSKDKENGVTSYVYDNANHVIKVTNPLGGETTYQYDGNGYKTSSIQKVEDLDIDFYYDEYDVEYTFNETEYEYNSLGYLTKETNPAGGETTYTYNSAGDLLTVTDPIGNTTTNTYDSYGNLVSKTDPRGYVTSYSYDLVGNLLSVTNALNQTTSYTYDNNNNLLSQTDPCGHTITYTYDALNRATAVTDAKGYTTYKTYDALGNVVQITDRQNHVDYAATYDALGRAVQTTDQAGSISTYTYDYAGNLTSLTNPLNQISYYAHDGMGRMTSSIDFAGKTSTAVYDNAGNVTEITGPTGAKQKYVYDSQSRTIRNFINTYNDYWETCDHYEDLRYNELGEVEIRYKGNLYTSSTYDVAGRITGFSDNDSNNTKTYDANGNIISEHNYSGTVSRVFDALNRVVSYSDVNGQTIEYEYDACGNLYRMKYPTGEYAVYSYDANHNLISSGIQGSNLVTTFQYDYKNRVTRIDNIDGSTVYKTYNAAGNLVNTADFDSDSHLIVVYVYQYDALGRLNYEFDPGSGIRYVMQYDSMGRVTNRTGYSGFTDTVVEEESYTYDDAGNITSATSFDGITHTFTYGTSNELLRYDNSYIGNDISGRTEKCVSMQSGNGGVYYDNLDRIRSINGSYNGYWYDADGNRIDMYYYSTNMMYSWDSSDGRNRLVWTKDHLLNATIYGYGPEGLLWSLCNGDYKIYHYDYRGSVVAITDIDGDVINTFKYDAYGKTVAKTGTGKSIFGYNGEYGVLTDPTGLLYMRTRYYSPDLKRFMTPDIIKGSIADSSSLNLYAFVNGDPINYVDPFGMDRSNTYKYNRSAAVNYAYDYYNNSNPEYVEFDDFDFIIYYFLTFHARTGYDCANFVSQCLVAGGIEENTEWHFDRYPNERVEWWLQIFACMKSGNLSYYDKNGNITFKPEEYDFTANWSKANSQFEYFSNPQNGYTIYDEPITISNIDEIEDAIDIGVQAGDLLYWSNDDGKSIHHATIINYVTYNDIYFAGHSISAYDKSLRENLKQETVKIVRLSDVQKKK